MPALLIFSSQSPGELLGFCARRTGNSNSVVLTLDVAVDSCHVAHCILNLWGPSGYAEGTRGSSQGPQRAESAAAAPLPVGSGPGGCLSAYLWGQHHRGSWKGNSITMGGWALATSLDQEEPSPPAPSLLDQCLVSFRLEDLSAFGRAADVGSGSFQSLSPSGEEKGGLRSPGPISRV